MFKSLFLRIKEIPNPRKLTQIRDFCFLPKQQNVEKISKKQIISQIMQHEMQHATRHKSRSK